MGTYIALLDFTEQGIRNIRDSPHRADQFGSLAEQAGAKIVAQYWTIGSHDGVLILEAPSDEVAASISTMPSRVSRHRTKMRSPCLPWPLNLPATSGRRPCGRSSGPTRRA